MLTIRPAETDDDLEQWRRVRLIVMPYERCASVAELRAMQRPGRLVVLAEVDGEVVGHGVADRSDLEGRAGLAPRVLPQHRRKGYGTALLRHLAEHAASVGHTKVSAMVDDPSVMGFPTRFGFAEVDRQVEQVRAIGDEPAPSQPSSFEIVSIAQRPELWPQAYHQVAVEAVRDMAVVAPWRVSLEEWERDWINAPSAAFVALVGDTVVGTASLMLDVDIPHRAEQGLTAVRRDWRGRSVASTLKRQTLWWAAQNGISEVYTWTQRGNDDMRALNEHLGFTYGHVSVTVERALPLN